VSVPCKYLNAVCKYNARLISRMLFSGRGAGVSCRLWCGYVVFSAVSLGGLFDRC
jgi:hypothetical protein